MGTKKEATMGGAMYVEVMVPRQIRSPYPVVFLHGAGQTGSPGPLDRVLTRVGAGQGHLQRLVATERDRVKLVAVREVYRFSAEGNYARVHTLAGNYLVRRSLVQLDERLDPGRFARIHRSDIVAIDAIKELQPLSHGDYDVVLRVTDHGDRFEAQIDPRH